MSADKPSLRENGPPLLLAAAKQPAAKSKPDSTKTAALTPPTESKPTRDGQRSLIAGAGIENQPDRD